MSIVKQPLEADARRVGGLCLLPGRFMVIRQAVRLPRSRGSLAAAFLARYVEGMKASGCVAESLARHHIVRASVATVQAGEG
jgi:polar amino acid transport system substrate-binding protein